MRGLVDQAFDLRETPYLLDACAPIVDWFERRPVRLYERRVERTRRLVRLLRETDPATIQPAPLLELAA